MGLGTNQFTGVSGDLDVFIPSIWSDRINNFAREELIAGKFFMDLSSEIANGGHEVFIPNVTAMTANSKSNGAEVTLNELGANLIVRLKSAIMETYKSFLCVCQLQSVSVVA